MVRAMDARRSTLPLLAALSLAPALAHGQAAPTAAPTDAPADTRAATESTALAEGLRAMQSEDYAAAIAAFERAARESESTAVYAHLGQANREIGRFAEAVAAWDRFLAAPPSDAAPEDVQRVRERRADALARCTRVRIRHSPVSASLTINGTIASERRSWAQVAADGTREVLLDPGQYRLILRANRYANWSTVIDAPERGAQRSFDVTLRMQLEENGTLVAGRRIPWWTWLGAGVAIAAGGTAITLGALQANAVASCGNDGTCVQSNSFPQSPRAVGVLISASIAAGGLILTVGGIVAGPSAPPSLASTLEPVR